MERVGWTHFQCSLQIWRLPFDPVSTLVWCPPGGKGSCGVVKGLCGFDSGTLSTLRSLMDQRVTHDISTGARDRVAGSICVRTPVQYKPVKSLTSDLWSQEVALSSMNLGVQVPDLQWATCKGWNGEKQQKESKHHWNLKKADLDGKSRLRWDKG